MAKTFQILDGGTGRELARIGAPFRQPEWSALALIEAPEYVTRVHEAYIAAGADIITTNSYALVPFHIGESRFASQAAALASLSGQLARTAANAAPRPVKVAASLPPVCGSYRPDLIDLSRARPILQTLIEALTPHIDLWQAETLSAIAEAELVADLTAKTGKPLHLSFTLSDDATQTLRSGESVIEATKAALRLKASALLFNCSQPEVMLAALQQARATAPNLTLGVYANAFPPMSADAEANSGLDPIRADLTPEGYANFAQKWANAGAQIIGGCCGIGPEHIAALANL
jgi:S-methylmethionine-dependent homocysteine/selenocysteine methylase